tara:strand:+ start:880 stop:1035 length:156 start_codon:yes stop_codon:yes gene_type:complete
MYKLNISELIRKPKKRKLKLSEIFYVNKKKSCCDKCAKKNKSKMKKKKRKY